MLKKQVKMFVFISWKKQVKMLDYFMIGFLWSLYSDAIFLWWGEKWSPNNKYVFELIKRRSKVQYKNISCECGLNFD